MENDTKNNEANEPVGEYGSKKITFFKSFEEENAYTHKQYAAMSPEERLASVTLMRLTAFPYLNTNVNPWGSIIYFD